MTLKQQSTAHVFALTLGCAALLAGTVAWPQAPVWELKQQEDDIFIYSRPVAGSAYNAIKATMLINLPANQLAKFMGNGNGCPQWRAMCKSSEVIENISDTERYVYTVIDLPWPASDRDMVLHTTTEVDAKNQTATVFLQSDSSRYPTSSYVRAETRGEMVIRAVSNEQVEFTYIMHTELGGSLPASRVNASLIDGAFEDLARLRKMAES